jgi:hypothetical protein
MISEKKQRNPSQAVHQTESGARQTMNPHGLLLLNVWVSQRVNRTYNIASNEERWNGYEIWLEKDLEEAVVTYFKVAYYDYISFERPRQAAGSQNSRSPDTINQRTRSRRTNHCIAPSGKLTFKCTKVSHTVAIGMVTLLFHSQHFACLLWAEKLK